MQDKYSRKKATIVKGKNQLTIEKMSKGFAIRLNTIYDILVKVTYPSPSISLRPIKATKNSWAMKLHRSKLKLDTTNGHKKKKKKKKNTCVQNEDLQELYEWRAILLTVKLIGQTREDYLSLVHVSRAETIILQFLTKQRNLKKSRSCLEQGKRYREYGRDWWIETNNAQVAILEILYLYN